MPEYKKHIDQIFTNERILLIRERLKKYQNIAKLFPYEVIVGPVSPPYYRHYLGIRLATWQDEKLFKHLDDLIGYASKMDGWGKSNKFSVVKTGNFSEYWSFLWELQVAFVFSNELGIPLQWTKKGPDLHGKIENADFFIECNVARKSYGTLLFIEEIYQNYFPQIKVDHSPWMHLNIKESIEVFEAVFAPLQNPRNLEMKLKRANKYGPVKVFPNTIREAKKQNFWIYFDGGNSKQRTRQFLPNISGDPTCYLQDVIPTIIKNKKVQIKEYRPNILAINMLLSNDYQIAQYLRPEETLQRVEEYDFLDGLWITSCGIDGIPKFDNSNCKIKPESNIHLFR